MSKIIDDFSAAELERIRKKVDTLSGPHVRNDPDRILIGGEGSRNDGDQDLDDWRTVTLDSNAAFGKYLGVIRIPNAAPTRSTQPLTVADAGDRGEDIVVHNLAESGLQTNSLTVPTQLIKVFRGFKYGIDLATNRSIVWIWCVGMEDCPVSVGQ